MMLLSLCACGGGESSTENNSEAQSEAVSENASTGEESKADESKPDASTEDPDGNGIIDDAAYEKYLEISKIDKTLEKRGFKDKGANSDYVPLNYDVMKAMWICQFDFGSIYSKGNGQNNEANFRAAVEIAFDNLVSMDFNTIIVQVRPNADSFYPSAYYPWSHYILGSYGKMANYDPLQIMIDEAHERNLSFHAWINPMRGMSPTDLAKVNEAYTWQQWKSTPAKSDYLYKHTDNLLYLNIAYEETRQIIIDGAREIVRNYDVDGIHMDDYFYFGETPEFDKKALAKATTEDKTLTRKKFRFNNLNTLISNLYSAIKEENKNVIFGISPAGNLDSMATKYFVDVNTWLTQDGYLDYIMPQIYFGMEHGSWSFTYTYNRWTAVTKNPNIKFIPGITFLKAIDAANGKGDTYAGSGVNEWIENKDVMERCLEFAVAQPNFAGFALFSYNEIWNVHTGAETTLIKEELDNCRKYFTDIIKGQPIKY